MLIRGLNEIGVLAEDIECKYGQLQQGPVVPAIHMAPEARERIEDYATERGISVEDLIRLLLFTGDNDDEEERELGEAITTAIFHLVMNRADRRGGGVEVEPMLRGIACAYAAAAYGLHDHAQAKALLLGLAAAMDDPATLRRVLVGAPDDPGGLPAAN